MLPALLAGQPEIALFLALAVGHAIGAIRFGPFQLGGICGTLVAALVIGQSGAHLDNDVKNVAFAVFIFALGFTGGPQFFANVGREWRIGLLSLVEVFVLLALLAIAVPLLRLDQGTAAGLLAGAATESAVIGTASEAIARLGVPAEQVRVLQTNIVTAYSVTYLFGLVSIVLFTSQLAPWLLRVNLRESAAQLWQKLGGENDMGDGQHSALPLLVGRLLRVERIVGKTVIDAERTVQLGVTIRRIRRGGDTFRPAPDEILRDGDVILAVGRRDAMVDFARNVGTELPDEPGMDAVQAEQDVLLTRKEVAGLSLARLRQVADVGLARGVYIQRITRMAHRIPPLAGTVLRRGDVLTLSGPQEAVQRVVPELGYPVTPTVKTDFVFLGIGVLLGMLLGALSVKVGQADLTLGTGGGCLVSGLIFGWLRARAPVVGSLPSPAAEILKDFGLATFIAAVGLSAGPDAVKLVREYGLILPVAGILVSVVPAAISLALGHWWLRLETPILLGAVAGQHCSTPTIMALTNAAGNGTPVIGYTITYAISNVLLPLLGPIAVAMAGALAR
ncbi:aspartate-alanine antiporter [Cupriavidus oxalaticus]|uniref:Aspartate-alanine antiporter n=1 Tax=Cupriavidus oxalaticus TaxID=96344 RepID=A0A5P3VQW4_9BURK|nr:aspartate-alanine antiporter [Cupriavidus oxalaticus]QEZ48557.1 aspartate-alanine antiporter [Cupriavidus oxalaticus]